MAFNEQRAKDRMGLEAASPLATCGTGILAPGPQEAEQPGGWFSIVSNLIRMLFVNSSAIIMLKVLPREDLLLTDRLEAMIERHSTLLEDDVTQNLRGSDSLPLVSMVQDDSHKRARTRTKLSPLQLRKLLSFSHPEDLKDQDLNLDQDCPCSNSADHSPAAAEHEHPDEVSRVFLIDFFHNKEGVLFIRDTRRV